MYCVLHIHWRDTSLVATVDTSKHGLKMCSQYDFTKDCYRDKDVNPPHHHQWISSAILVSECNIIYGKISLKLEVCCYCVNCVGSKLITENFI